MALSNWDHAAWDKFGDPRKGEMKFPNGIRLEIYKDWLYIYDPTARGAFIDIGTDDISIYEDPRNENICQVNNGKVYYKRIYINVHRDKIHGTFIHASRYLGDYDEVTLPIVLCGIGKYGFGGNDGHKWVGITDDDVKAFNAWLKKIKSPVEEIRQIRAYNQGDAYFCGVEKAMNRYDSAESTVMEHLIKEAFR